MRSLAGSFGVEAMSLYNHVTNKDDLLDGMVDLVMGRSRRPRPTRRGAKPCGGVRSRRARRTPAIRGRRRWSTRARASVPGRLASFDATIGCLRRAGFSHALTVHALSTLDAFVHGFAAHRLHVAQAEVPDDVAMAEALDRWLPAERYPHLSALVHEHVLVGLRRGRGLRVRARARAGRARAARAPGALRSVAGLSAPDPTRRTHVGSRRRPGSQDGAGDRQGDGVVAAVDQEQRRSAALVHEGHRH
jgi:AcrR family transcriptional regulator